MIDQLSSAQNDLVTQFSNIEKGLKNEIQNVQDCKTKLQELKLESQEEGD